MKLCLPPCSRGITSICCFTWFTNTRQLLRSSRKWSHNNYQDLYTLSMGTKHTAAPVGCQCRRFKMATRWTENFHHRSDLEWLLLCSEIIARIRTRDERGEVKKCWVCCRWCSLSVCNYCHKKTPLVASPPYCFKPVLNWANVCSPEHTSDTSTNYDSFLDWTFSSPNIVRTVQTLLHFQLAWNEMQASARTCGRRAADSMIENVG